MAMPTAKEAYADTVRVHISTVERTREKFVTGGLNFALKDEPHPPKLRKLEGKQEAFLIATACSDPPSGQKHIEVTMAAYKARWVQNK